MGLKGSVLARSEVVLTESIILSAIGGGVKNKWQTLVYSDYDLDTILIAGNIYTLRLTSDVVGPIVYVNDSAFDWHTFVLDGGVQEVTITIDNPLTLGQTALLKAYTDTPSTDYGNLKVEILEVI